MTNQQGAPEALAHELFTAAQLAPGEGIEDAVSRIAAALTAAPSVSDGLRTLHDAILNRLSHAELLEKAHYLMELNSNQARTIGELQDLVEAAHAQPAAPQGVAKVNWWEADGDKYDASIPPMQPAQGVAYAELPRPDACDGVSGAVAWSDVALRDFADRTHALRASNGQAPACKGSSGECTFNGACMYACGAAPAAGAVAAPSEADQEEVEAVIACLGDDAATLREQNPECEMAANMDRAAELLAAAPTPAAQADSVLKDHQIAALVNELRDIAVEFQGTQQLRERIAQVVVPALKAQKADSVLEDAAREVLMEHSGCGGGTQVDMLTVRLNPGDRVVMFKGRITQAVESAARKQGGKHDNH